MEITTLHIIGITGHAGVGADWVADNILARLSFWPIALADASTAADPAVRCSALERWLRIWHARWGIQRFVVTDVRSRSELSWIHRMGGKVLALKGDRTRVLTAEENAHCPEVARTIGLADACCWNELGAPYEAIKAQVESALRRWAGAWCLDGRIV
jgi:hypothetical protein